MGLGETRFVYPGTYVQCIGQEDRRQITWKSEPNPRLSHVFMPATKLFLSWETWLRGVAGTQCNETKANSLTNRILLCAAQETAGNSTTNGAASVPTGACLSPLNWLEQGPAWKLHEGVGCGSVEVKQTSQITVGYSYFVRSTSGGLIHVLTFLSKPTRRS
jgi:hypothetical protein